MNNFGIADALLLHFGIERLDGSTVLAGKNVLGLLGYHLVSLAHDDVKHSLCADDLRRRSDKRRLTEVFTHTRNFLKHFVELVFCVLFFQL